MEKDGKTYDNQCSQADGSCELRSERTIKRDEHSSKQLTDIYKQPERGKDRE